MKGDIINYCKCGCGTEIAEDKTWARGYYIRLDATKAKQSVSAKKRWEDPKEREKVSDSLMGHIISGSQREKLSKATKKHYVEMDDPGQEICNHHYIYDFNNLTKYTIEVTRSEHMVIHQNLRRAGLEVPCINIMVDD